VQRRRAVLRRSVLPSDDEMTDQEERSSTLAGSRLATQEAEDGSELMRLARRVYASKLRVLGAIALGAVLAAILAWVLPPIYRSEIVLAPAQRTQDRLSSLAGDLGGLASLAGVNLQSQQNTTETVIAVLKSRAFTYEFIEANNLLPVLFASYWDKDASAWRVERDSEKFPTLRKAYDIFDREIRGVRRDRTGLVTVSIEWTDPELTARWANDLVRRLNRHEQEQAINESNRKIEFLKKQLDETSLAEVQQLIYRLIESEVKDIMLANVHDDYAFRVIDPATVPEKKVRPQRALMVVLGALVGLLAGVFLVMVRAAVERRESA
jgi:uncharacterized protein involved in exopolysaccharide biosynthesis